MKLNIKWRYPNEEEMHEHTFFDINPQSVSIQYSMLHFHGNEDPYNKSWNFPISHVIEMRMEEE